MMLARPYTTTTNITLIAASIGPVYGVVSTVHNGSYTQYSWVQWYRDRGLSADCQTIDRR